MTNCTQWHPDPELAGLIREMAEQAGRPFEEMATILLLNGLNYTIAVAMERGTCTDEKLYQRIKGASLRAPTNAPRERHYPGPRAAHT